MFFAEGAFRKARLWSNRELKKFSPLYSGDIVNVSAGKDKDKEIDNILKYFRDANSVGGKYEEYFNNAKSYTTTNYPGDYKNKDNENEIWLDLEKKLPEEYVNRFDVVFNHTVLEHVFDVKTAFKNLCKMSKDTVIIVLPFIQQVHDYSNGYCDYWRFTPFAIEKLFEENGMDVLYRSSNKNFGTSIYYFFIATKQKIKWEKEFNCKDIHDDLSSLNLGGDIFMLTKLQLKVESVIRKIFKLFRM